MQNEDEKFEIIRAIKEHNNPTLKDIYNRRVGEMLKKVFVTKATEGFNVMTFENSRGRSSTFRFFESKGIELVRLDECELADSIGDFEDDEQIDESLYKEDIHYNAE
jgi:hypothetical protein